MEFSGEIFPALVQNILYKNQINNISMQIKLIIWGRLTAGWFEKLKYQFLVMKGGRGDLLKVKLSMIEDIFFCFFGGGEFWRIFYIFNIYWYVLDLLSIFKF